MSALVYAVVFCIVAVLVYMGRYSGRLRVTETRIIDAPLAAVRARVLDLQRWGDWSPWLESDVEPLRSAADGTRIEQRMRLKKPFPLRGRSAWQLAEVQGKTEATWSLRGRVAFSMRAFAATVQGAIALDFRHGLDRLAALVEPAAAARYAISFEGVREVAALRYAWIAHEGPIGELGAAIGRVVGEVRAALARHGVAATGEPIGVYVKTNVKWRTSMCRFGVPIGAVEVEGLEVATLPTQRAFCARLQGSRAQLEIAWYLVMQRLSAEGLKPDLRVAPFERYLGGTDHGDSNEAVTELHLAVL
jgi:hypothetical protein